jgi:hypothetical protein
MSKTILEFMIHYLADPALRRRVLYRELTAMRDFGLSNGDALLLQGLDETTIFAKIEKEIEAALADKSLQGKLKSALAGVGFDAAKAYGIIYGGGSDCEPRVKAVTMASAYGEGEVHIRGVVPHTIGLNERARIEIRGQGFGPGVAVRFFHAGANKTTEGWVVERRCDVDVHQYLVVDVVLSVIGYWNVELFNDITQQWTRAHCGVTVP